MKKDFNMEGPKYGKKEIWKCRRKDSLKTDGRNDRKMETEKE
jgi:hypothetical protein